VPIRYLIALLSLSACRSASAEPPLGPSGETAAVNVPPRGVEQCMTLLRAITNQTDAHIDRSLITSSRRWGLLFRADFSSGNPPVHGRYVCQIDRRGPLVISFQLKAPPLASGPWGSVTRYR
jgi:hypothetical protein